MGRSYKNDNTLNTDILKEIIFLNDSMVLAGTEILLLQLINHLQGQNKINVTLLLPYPSPQNVLLDQLDAKAKVIYVHEQMPRGWRKKWSEIQMIFAPDRFRKTKQIDTSKYDCCIAFKEGFFANVFARIQQPNILWIHNLLYHRQYEVKSLKEKLAIGLNKKEIKKTYQHYKGFDQIVCVSQACKKAFQKVLFTNEVVNRKIKVLPNGVNMQHIQDLSLQKNPNFDENCLNFVLVTRNSVDKEPSRILFIAKYLKDHDVSNIKIHVVGIRGDEDFVNRCPYQEEIKEYITFYGVLQNPYPYIKYADWSLCVSDRESFSLSVLESLILSTPVLTTACGGPEDILDNGRLGMIVENSSIAVADAIVKIAHDPTIASSYKKEMSKSLEYYSLNNWLLQAEKLIELS